jgi:hypothetical protein
MTGELAHFHERRTEARETDYITFTLFTVVAVVIK